MSNNNLVSLTNELEALNLRQREIIEELKSAVREDRAPPVVADITEAFNECWYDKQGTQIKIGDRVTLTSNNKFPVIDRDGIITDFTKKRVIIKTKFRTVYRASHNIIRIPQGNQ